MDFVQGYGDTSRRGRVEESPGGQVHECGIYQLRKKSRSPRAQALWEIIFRRRALDLRSLSKRPYIVYIIAVARGGQQDHARIPKLVEQTHNDSNSLRNNKS